MPNWTRLQIADNEMNGLAKISKSSVNPSRFSGLERNFAGMGDADVRLHAVV
jgi:hypothetical protein